MKEVKRRRGRIFGAGILLLMTVLALATVVLAAGGWASGGSYSLVIQKQFAANTPDDVLAAAQQQTYTFHIEGYRLDGKGNRIEIDEIVTIGPDSTDWTSEAFTSDGPIHVSVTEITNDVTLKVGGQEYNMGDSRVETTTMFNESPQVRELNNNGRIVLSRPEKKLVSDGNGGFTEVPVTTTSTFRITSEWTASPHAKPADWQPFSWTGTLAPGETHEFENLSAGKYTIEDLSVSGYTIKLGSRGEDVGLQGEPGIESLTSAYSAREGEAEKQTHGTFYINSYPGSLVITAGGTAGDGGKHYYTVKRIDAPSDARPFMDRTTDAVASKGTYTLNDLPKGQYEVTEYTFTDAPTEFKVKVPETEDKLVTKYILSKYFTDNTESKQKMWTLSAGGDYIDNFSFGPMQYRKNGKYERVPSTVTYTMYYGQYKGEETTSYSFWTSTGRKAYTQYSSSREFTPYQGVLWFGVWNVQNPQNAPAPERLQVQWTEHTRVENNYTEKLANTNYSVTVDERGWIEIAAPAKSDSAGADQVTYTYTLRKADGSVIAKREDLAPGQTVKFEGLEAGSYQIMETLSFAEPVGFHMEISGGPFGSTEAGKPSEITVMEPRELTITKPEGKEGDTRTYTFRIDKAPEKTRSADNTQSELTFPITVTLKAGQTSTAILLPAGKYTVTPVDDLTEVFELKCTDSSQVHAEVPSGQSSNVTFTNVFTTGEYGYRYVHEYYIKESDGSYVYEGSSPVTTVGGRSEENEFYNSVDIAKEKVFTFTDSRGDKQTFHYEYMPENNGYGYVDSGPSDGGGYEVARGLRSSNQSMEKDSAAKLYYHVDEGLTDAKKIGVDKDKSQIIILRYFRVLPEDQRGHYKYIHVYYRRDDEGDHWEGSSLIGTNPGQVGLRYSAEGNVDPVTKFTPTYGPDAGKQEFTYVYDQRPNYGTLSEDHSDSLVEDGRTGLTASGGPEHYHYRPNSNADYVIATDAPDASQQIIILRYYRTVSPAVGTYKVVHEYYYREKLEDQDPGDVSEDMGNGEEDGADVQSEGGIAPQADDEASSEAGDGGEAEDPGTDLPGSSGTLSSDSQYVYTFEGARTVETISAPLGSTHKGADVERRTNWKPSGSGTSHLYTYKDAVYGNTSGEGRYSYVSNMEWASSTEEGSEIIILRYYRGDGPDKPDEPDKPDPDPPGGGGGRDPDPTGSYQVVHEYYLQDSTGSKVLEGVSEIVKRSGDLDRRYYKSNVREVPQFKGQRYTYTDCGYGTVQSEDTYTAQDGKTYVVATEAGDQIIILRYVRRVEELPKGSYKVVHEYYHRTGDGDVLEGTTEIDTVDDLLLDGTQYTEAGVARRYTFEDREYVYLDAAYGKTGGDSYQADPEMAYVVATEEGEEIVILRYIREDEPEVPPDPEDPPEPEEPEKPGLPDPNDPDSPETVTVEEDGVPKVYVKIWDPDKEEWIYVLEDEVPLGDQSPRTGDSSRTALWAALAAGSLCGAAMMFPAPRKRKER